ncbi:MAG: TldD/PmbA family protein [Elusimicrobiota bacterium]|nr:TldD/PmbA family protein [Elusimicrobiota bacterium]
MDEMEKLLLAGAAESRELFTVEKRGSSYSLMNGEPEEEKESLSGFAASLRILKNGKMGFSWTNDRNALSKMAADSERMLFDAASWGWQIALSGGDSPPAVEIRDDKGMSFESGLIWESLRSMEKEARGRDCRITKCLSASFSGSSSKLFIANSSGKSVTARKTAFSESLVLVAESGGEVQIGSSHNSGCFREDIDRARIIDEAVDDAVSQFAAVSLDSAPMTVLLPSHTACVFLSIIEGWFCADEFLEGRAPRQWQEGFRAGSELLNVTDDGTIPRLIGSMPFDSEGVAVKRHEIIKDGVFREFLTDFRTASLMDRKSTGNAVRSVSSLPQPGFFNLFIENGKDEISSLLGEGDVLQIDEVIGTHLVDPQTARFSFGARGRLYRKGKPVKNIRGITISGGLLDFLRNIKGVGNDLKFYSSTGSPSLLVSGVQVSGE